MATNRDAFLENLLKSKISYLILLVFVIVFLFSDDKVLNLPKHLFALKFMAVLLAISSLFILRFLKYKSYYKRKLKDRVYRLGLLLGITIFSLIIQGVLNIPINYLVKLNSKNSVNESFDCEITNVVTTNIDKIHFKFLGEIYSRYYNVNEYDRKDLMNNYLLNLQVKKSILGTYYIESMALVRKR